jgi:hypothetical protein
MLMPPKPRVPAIEGWFTRDAQPHLVGLRDPLPLPGGI